MATDERDNRDMGLDDQSDMYEQDPAYSTDTYFGERLDKAPEEEVVEDSETVYEVEEFGETMPADETAASGDEAGYEEDAAAEEEGTMGDETKK